MTKTIVLRKVNLLSLFIKIGIPLVATGAIIGFIMGFFVTPAGDSTGNMSLKLALVLGIQGLLIAMAITIIVAVYNIILALVSGTRLFSGEPDRSDN